METTWPVLIYLELILFMVYLQQLWGVNSRNTEEDKRLAR